MDREFWQGKRVFVTGHTGFKGGWLSLWLQSWGARVSGYSLAPPTTPNFFEACRIAEGVYSTEGDIRDFDRLSAAIAELRPEIVIHMAAQPLVRYSYGHPVETYTTNVIGTVHVLEAVRNIGGVRVVINVTSDKCYDNREWIWGYRESEPMGGYDPYSSSKGCAELVTSAYRQSYFNPEHHVRHGVSVASARAGNVIGGGDWAADRLIPDIVRAIRQGETVAIRNPQAIRPWQHVLEPLSGYMQLAQCLWEEGPRYAEGWNFGPSDDDARPVSWIVEYLARKWGAGASWRTDDVERPHEAAYLKLDCSKARSRLQWRPRWRLEQALDNTISWYQAYESRQDMREISLKQIQAYVHNTPVESGA